MEEEAPVCPMCPSHPFLIDQGERSRWYCCQCEEMKGMVQQFSCKSCDRKYCEECAWADLEQEDEEDDEGEEDWEYDADADADYWDVGELQWAWEVGELEHRLEHGLPTGPSNYAYDADYAEEYPDDYYAEDDYWYYDAEWSEIGTLTCDVGEDDRRGTAADTEVPTWDGVEEDAQPVLTESEKAQAASEIKRILKVPTGGGA
mmetsp:Transcript_100434/g.139618  ORF Transcript_100434/g.139618 Transcript_100434/m.139618 type:complete len:203 (+) Transcript_100434:85-693(+)